MTRVTDVEELLELIFDLLDVSAKKRAKFKIDYLAASEGFGLTYSGKNAGPLSELVNVTLGYTPEDTRQHLAAFALGIYAGQEVS